MSLDKMWNLAKCTKTDFDLAFQEIAHNVGELSYETLRYYMQANPENAGYLFTTARGIARDNLKQRIIGKVTPFSSPNILFHTTDKYNLIPRMNMLKTFDTTFNTLMATQELIETNLYASFILGICVFCQGVDSHQLMTIRATSNHLIKMAGMFDSTHQPTLAAVQTVFNNMRDQSRILSLVAGVCLRCNKPCQMCGDNMSLPRITLENLDGFIRNRTCSNCGGDNIVKLPVPKPNNKEFRAYKVKLNLLRQTSMTVLTKGGDEIC